MSLQKDNKNNGFVPVPDQNPMENRENESIVIKSENWTTETIVVNGLPQTVIFPSEE